MDKENQESFNELLSTMENLHFPPNSLYSGIFRQKALASLKSDELKSINFLTQSHCLSLQFKAALQYDQLLTPDENVPLTINKANIDSNCNFSDDIAVQNMLKKVAELPKEWTIVQLTTQFDVQESLAINRNKKYTNSVHISVFNCGQSKIKPLCVTCHAPRDKINGNVMEICQELSDILTTNSKSLTASTATHFANVAERKAYAEKRMSLIDRLKNVVKDVEDYWICNWKCLLIGKFVNEDIEKKLTNKVDEFLKSESVHLSDKEHYIFCAFLKGYWYYKLGQFMPALQAAFPSFPKNVRMKMYRFMQNCNQEFNLQNELRHPVILIIDEKLDCVPWEMLGILQDHPVTRMPSFNFTYALYKEHEATIKNGAKTNVKPKNGCYIVNPEQNLKNMQQRMLSFFKYWTDWPGIEGTKPSSDEFEQMLKNHDILCYCGHGHGGQFLSGDKIQKLRIETVVLLFGCRSVGLSEYGPQVEMCGQHNMYLIACSPCVIGMLWTVTDVATDTLSTNILSHWLPSDALQHWKNVDQKHWQKLGEINFTSDATNKGVLHEPELLRVLAKAKKSGKCFMTAAACVARGLPIKIENS